MITRLDHIQLAMPPGEEERARAFWCTLLGLTEEAKPEPLASRLRFYTADPFGNRIEFIAEGDGFGQK